MRGEGEKRRAKEKERAWKREDRKMVTQLLGERERWREREGKRFSDRQTETNLSERRKRKREREGGGGGGIKGDG